MRIRATRAKQSTELVLCRYNVQERGALVSPQAAVVQPLRARRAAREKNSSESATAQSSARSWAKGSKSME